MNQSVVVITPNKTKHMATLMGFSQKRDFPVAIVSLDTSGQIRAIPIEILDGVVYEAQQNQLQS